VLDHRREAGRRYPLASLRLIAVAAMLSGRRDQLGIVRWGRRLSREALEAIGISRNRVPAPSVWYDLFQGLNIAVLERVLGHWVRGEQPAEQVAIDGKRLRGSAKGQSPGVHLLAAFSAKLQGVIGQLRVAPEASEIIAALELLRTAATRGHGHHRCQFSLKRCLKLGATGVRRPASGRELRPSPRGRNYVTGNQAARRYG
jgi:hypothetical protein